MAKKITPCWYTGGWVYLNFNKIGHLHSTGNLQFSAQSEFIVGQPEKHSFAARCCFTVLCCTL